MSPADRTGRAVPAPGAAARPRTDPGTAAVASLPDASGHGEPLFTVTHGNPTPEDLAALVAVLGARSAPQPTPRARSTKASRSQTRRVRLGLRLRPGRGAWRWTQPER